MASSDGRELPLAWAVQVTKAATRAGVPRGQSSRMPCGRAHGSVAGRYHRRLCAAGLLQAMVPLKVAKCGVVRAEEEARCCTPSPFADTDRGFSWTSGAGHFRHTVTSNAERLTIRQHLNSSACHQRVGPDRTRRAGSAGYFVSSKMTCASERTNIGFGIP